MASGTMLSPAVSFTPATEPVKVIDHLQPVLLELHAALLKGVPIARSWFDDRGYDLEKNLFAALVRCHAKAALKSLGAVDEDYKIGELAFLGLSVRTNEVAVRVLKSPDSEVPTTQSKQRLRFYQQNLFADQPSESIRPLNVVVLWDTDYMSSLSLRLACPKGQYKRVECHWNEPLDELFGSVELSEFVLEDGDLEVTSKEEDSSTDLVKRSAAQGTDE